MHNQQRKASVLLDTGSNVNLIDSETVKTLGLQISNVADDKKLQSLSGVTTIEQETEFTIKCPEIPHTKYKVKAYVC